MHIHVCTSTRAHTPWCLREGGWEVGGLTLACLSSSSASSMRFFRKEETRRDLKSMSSGEEGKRHGDLGRACGPRLGPGGCGLTLLGGVGEALEALAAQLLVALGGPHLPVPGSSLVQRLVGILVVGQCPQPPVQQVLGPRAQGHCCPVLASRPERCSGAASHLCCL